VEAQGSGYGVRSRCHTYGPNARVREAFQGETWFFIPGQRMSRLPSNPEGRNRRNETIANGSSRPKIAIQVSCRECPQSDGKADIAFVKFIVRRSSR
jgi:hypothetical protein